MADFVLDIDYDIAKAEAKANKLNRQLELQKSIVEKTQKEYQNILYNIETVEDKYDRISSQADEHLNKIKELENEYENVLSVEDRFGQKGAEIKNQISEQKELYSSVSSQLDELNREATILENKEANKSIELQKQIDKLYNIGDELTVHNIKQEEISNSITASANQQEKLANTATKTAKQQDKVSKSAKSTGKAFKSAQNPLDKFYKKIVSLVKQIFVFAVITKALNAIKDAVKGMFSQNDKLSKSFAQLKGNLSVIGAIFTDTIMPVVQWIVDALVKITSIIGATFAKLLGKDVSKMAEMAKNAEDVAEASENATASWDTLQKIDTSNKSNSENSIDTSAITSVELPEWIDKIPELFNNIDFSSIFEKLKSGIQNAAGYFKEQFSPAIESSSRLAMHIFDGMKDSGERVLKDFVKNSKTVFKTMKNDVIPVYAGILDETIKTLEPLFDFFKGLFDRIYEDVISPFTDLFIGIWSDMWEDIHVAWDKYGATVFESIRTIIKGISDVLFHVWDTIIKPVFDYLWDSLQKLWKEHLEPVFNVLLEFFGKLWELLGVLWSFIEPIIMWIIDTIAPTIMDICKVIIDIIMDVFGIISDVVGGVFEILNGILDFIIGVFTGDWERAWDGIVGIFKGIWDFIWGIIKGVINLVIDALNLLWSGIYSVVRTIVNGLGSVISFIGDLFGQDWGFSIPDEAPKIPRLAQGGVIPGGSPQLVMFGDQRRGQTNIEAPEPLLRQIVREESGQQTPTLVIEATGSMSQLIKLLNLEIKKEDRRSSIKAVKV